MELFRNQPIRKVPVCQLNPISSLSPWPTRSLLVYKSRLPQTTTTTTTSPSHSHSHSHSHTGGGGGGNRLQEQWGSWDKLPRDVLIKIFNLLPFRHALFVIFYPLVCRSWLYAAVDIVYPHFTTVIDLRFLSTISPDIGLRFMVYLKLALDTRPQTQWTALYLPEKIGITKDDFLYIAQRTPCLQYLDWPYGCEFYLSWHWEAISSWKNLKGIDLGYNIGKNFFTSCWSPCSFAYYFKNLRSLRLVRKFGVEQVSEIIKALFPQLDYFSLRDSCLTMDAASLVVSEVVATNTINNNNSHQVGIQTLDMRHCAFISSHFSSMDSVVANQSLVEAEIHEKAAAAIKTYLHCEGLELCSHCKVKHCHTRNFYKRPRRQTIRPPQVLVETNMKFFGSSSLPSPLGTTKRLRGPDATTSIFIVTPPVSSRGDLRRSISPTDCDGNWCDPKSD